MNLQRFLSIIKKELIQLKRDKASFGIAIMMPIVMTFLFGYAVNTQLKDVKLVVVDNSNSTESKELIEEFKSDEYFKVTIVKEDEEQIRERMDRGKEQGVIIIPKDFSDKLLSKEKTEVRYIVDGSNPTTAKTATMKGELVVQKYSKSKLQVSKNSIQDVSKSIMINTNTEILYNPDLRNENYTIPGLIGLILQNVTLLLTSFALVRERERGTIEQLVVSPLTPSEIIIGKLVPYVLIGFLDFLLALALGIVTFNVPINGSLWLLIILGLLFVICSLSIGILISTISKTQLQAMQLSVFIILPSVLLSGFIFPRDAMPKIIQVLGNFIPLTYFLNIIRGIVTKGIGMEYLMTDVVLLSGLSVGLLVLSIMRYRRKAF